MLLPVIAFALIYNSWCMRQRGPGPDIVCHKQIHGAFVQWSLETTNAPRYPNIQGDSSKSLNILNAYIKDATAWLHDYRYVPGLSASDPPDLTLMYVAQPSRRTWHGDQHWLLGKKRWVVLNTHFDTPPAAGYPSELGEWIPTSEFTNRLAKTLQYLAANNRPYWTNVVKEHSAFLQALLK